MSRHALWAMMVTCALSLAPSLSNAQTPPAQQEPSETSVANAELGQRVVELGQSFEYTISASTSSNKKLRVLKEPDLRPFSVVNRSQKMQMMTRNGVFERSLEVTYRLRTRRIGDKIVIAPPVFAIGDERISPKSVTIKVVKKGAGPKKKQAKVRDDAAYVDTSVSLDRQPYVGEQIVLQYDLFINSRKIDAQPNPPSEPSLDDFWIEELNDRTMGSRQLVRMGTKEFFDKILLRRYAVYPLHAGKTVIDPMTVPLVMGGFMKKRKNVELSSKPITLDVQPLPAGAPAEFYEGNVGEWDFLVTSDSLRTRVGRAVTIRISAKGNGQVGRIQLPGIEELPDARIGGSEQSITQNVRGGQMIGEKLVTYAITPLKEGVLTLPALKFAYFDPEAGEYRTKQSSPIAIEVSKGELPPEPEQRDQPVSRNETSQRDVMSALKSELAGIHRRDERLKQPSVLEGGFEATLAYKIILALSLALMAGVLGAPLWRRLMRRDSPSRQRAAIYQAAVEDLKMARADESYELIARAIKIYCVDALGMLKGHVSDRELARRLQALGLEQALAQELEQVLRQTNAARYASSTDAPKVDELAASAQDVLKRVHRTMSKVLKETPLKSRAFELLVMGALCAGLAAPGEAMAEPTVTVESAMTAHDAHEWDDAVAQWTQLAERMPHHPDVHYALGTAALQKEDLGVAVLALERALLLRPQDKEVANNLRIARRMVRVKAIESLRGRSQVLAGDDEFFWWDLARKSNSSTLALMLLIAIWVVISVAFVRPRIKEDVTRDLTGIVGILGLIVVVGSAVAWIARADVMKTTHPVVLLDDGAVFRDGPSEHAAQRAINSPMVAGSRYVMEEERKGWLKIRLPDDSSGWIERTKMGQVVIPRP